MKRSTIELYGINPLDLADMPYRIALIACREGAKRRLYEVMQDNFKKRDDALANDISKAQDWCNAKLGEIE